MPPRSWFFVAQRDARNPERGTVLLADSIRNATLEPDAPEV